MKYAMLIAGMLSVFIGGANAQDTAERFLLNGKILQKISGTMYLFYSNNNEQRIQDSAVIDNGLFSFKGNISGPTMAYLQLKEAVRDPNNTAGLFLEPASMRIELQQNNFRRAKLTGSTSQDEYAALEMKKQRILDRWKIVMDTLSAVNERSNVQFQELKDWVLTPYNAEMDELDLDFFANHPQSSVTAYLLNFHVNDLTLDSLQMYYDRLGRKVQQSPNGKSLDKEIKKLRAGSPGSIAVDFTATDINGKVLNLSDFKGKYVLLDFWASWCVPCRRSNPHMIDLYKKYHNNGLEIIGVSDDDGNQGAWKKAVEKDGVGIWHNVLRGFDMDKLQKGEVNERDISEKFGIHSLPTKILIDKNGVIIGRYDHGTDEEARAMDAKLAQLLSAN